MKLIWLSDLHFLASGHVLGHDPRLRLEAAISHISACYPDAEACIITGDLVESAEPEHYEALQAHLSKLPGQLLPLTGNHDDRDLLRQVFPLPNVAMADFVQYRVDFPRLSVVALDTLVSGQGYGFLCAQRLEWLQQTLDDCRDRPLLLAMHHPPMKLGLPILDEDNLRNGQELLELLKGRNNIQHLLLGHVHRPVAGLTEGIPFKTSKSILYQAPPAVPAWDWESFSPAPEAPAYTVIEVTETGVTLQEMCFCPYELGIVAQ